MKMNLPLYRSVVGVLAASVFLAACGGDSGSTPGSQTAATPTPTPDPGVGSNNSFPLLGSTRGGHVWADFCQNQPDSAALPLDPRTLITEGANAGRNVVFNAPWQSCFVNDPLRPETCGEYRALYERGALVGRGQGEPGTAHMFSGDARSGINFTDPTTWGNESLWTVSADQYNTLWQAWTGYNLPPASRPENFDELIAHRYGSTLPAERNPYPLPGEDPNASDGGSGQLPIVFTQLRDEDDNWTGIIGVKLCSFCHDGQQSVDGSSEPVYGGMGTIGDFHVAFRDFAAVGAAPFGLLSGLPLTVASNRGTGAIDQFQVGFIAFNGGTAEELMNPRILLSQAIGNIKSPPWWNMGSRPQKFHGAVLHMDSSRIDMAAYYPLAGGSGGDPVAWVDEASYPFQIWAESLKAPEYPGEINTALAEAGAILFHSKNLWANGDNPVAEPANPGNGSCASCHGAYSPRFINDPAFLADPRMGGIAANVNPASLIGTDPKYADGMQSLREPDGSTNAGVNAVSFLICGTGEAGRTENNEPIMLAPPLHGIWSSAPFFHNASVPNIWGVLDPENERPVIWKRVSAPAPGGLDGRVVTGFDTNFDRAYDADKLGWKYEVLDCVEDPAETAPLLTCSPAPIPVLAPEGESPLQGILDVLYAQFALTWNLSVDEAHLIPFTDQQIESRKVYNTHIYSQGNEGHAFTAVLSDAERRAIIEYLKTL